MGVEKQIRPTITEAAGARIARGVLAKGWEDPWDCDNQAGLDVLGIHAPAHRRSPVGETEGADDDGALDTPATEPSP